MINTPAPPYGLATPSFPFRRLAALAGRMPMGESRTVAIACLLVARLAHAVLPPVQLPLAARGARATAAQSWLGTLALPANARKAFAAVVEASGDATTTELARRLTQLLQQVRPVLDDASRHELEVLIAALREARAE